VVEAAQRSRDLVAKILAFSRREGEQRRESVDLGQVLREALGLMRATLPASIRIEETIVPPPPLETDPGQLQQAIVNLMTNAAQAIGDAVGTIGVRLEPAPNGAHVRLSVSDTGCGMDEATKTRLFEPFFTTRDVGKGTGLGLAVVHGIIKGHGGRIEVESAPGQGARFDVILPIRPAAAAGFIPPPRRSA
jgi:signal transduction histidine kinase